MIIVVLNTNATSTKIGRTKGQRKNCQHDGWNPFIFSVCTMKMKHETVAINSKRLVMEQRVNGSIH